MIICEFDLDEKYVKLYVNVKSLCIKRNLNYYKMIKICSSLYKQDHLYQNKYFYYLDQCYFFNGHLLIPNNKYIN